MGLEYKGVVWRREAEALSGDAIDFEDFYGGSEG